MKGTTNISYRLLLTEYQKGILQQYFKFSKHCYNHILDKVYDKSLEGKKKEGGDYYSPWVDDVYKRIDKEVKYLKSLNHNIIIRDGKKVDINKEAIRYVGENLKGSKRSYEQFWKKYHKIKDQPWFNIKEYLDQMPKARPKNHKSTNSFTSRRQRIYRVNKDYAYIKIFTTSIDLKLKFKIDRWLFDDKYFNSKWLNEDKVANYNKNAPYSSFTIKEEQGNYFIVFTTNKERRRDIVSNKIKNTNNKIIGIDMGVRKFAVLSDDITDVIIKKEGRDDITVEDGYIHSPDYKYYQKEVAYLNNKMDTKYEKYSNNWKRTLSKINKLKRKEAQTRKHFLNEVSTFLIRNYDTIIVEDLKIKNMSKSAKGNEENHGKNVKQKSGLNRVILSEGWGLFFRMLEYKCQWHDKSFIKVPPNNTSRTCPNCGNTDERSRNGERFLCVVCSHEDDADKNGSLNIKNKGIKMLTSSK